MLRGIFFAIGVFVACTSPQNSTSPDAETALSIEERDERNQECDLYLSFAITNYQNRDFPSTIDNFKHVIDIGCGKRNAEDIYQWMGRSYIEMNKLDSANYIFKQGLKYLKEDESLYEVAAWNAGKLGNVEEQIYYLDQWLGLNESNTKVLEKMSDLYRDQGRFEEQIDVLNIWLKLDSGNKKANAEKKAAFSALGKDEINVDKERWEADPSNMKYGIDYAKGLLESGMDKQVIDVANSLLVYEKFNTDVLRLQGDAYMNLYIEDQALESYEAIANIDPSNYVIAIDISKIYINKEDFKSALIWAETAIKSSGKKGEAIYQRAEVYYSLAENCTGDALSFWDKIVFEIAWQDYDESVKSGYYRAKTRRDFLAENSITSTSDWFMRPDGEREVTPQTDCYSWIKDSCMG